jgi:protein-S-isoprenylcysteine O-methyltransferase Ste14
MSLELVIFIVLSAAIVWVSRASLRRFRSHGFYRFLAWEAIAALITLNLQGWFADPFSPHQLLSWPLLVASLALVVHGYWLLSRVGKPDGSRDDAALVGLEKTTELVTVGAYRYIRHPLYSSLLFLTWGTFLKGPSWLGLALALVATLFLTATAKVEEAENTRYFGAAYQSYMQTTRMFIPFVF